MFIAGGAALLDSFGWVIYLFGAFLIYTGVKMARHGDQEVHPERNPVLRLVRRIMPVTEEYHGTRFFLRRAGRTVAAPLFAVLVAIETPTYCSRSTRSRPSSPSPTSRSSCSPRTPSPFWACGRCISYWPG